MSKNLEKVELYSRLEESYMSYAMATIVDRALPDVRDGVLPIHRRILYAMYKAGLTYNKERAKSTEPVSETMKIHHHGDSSIYDSLALLTEQNETLLHPFLDGEGSFGKVYSTDSPSHMRYTFCRLNKFSEEMFQGLNKNILKMIGEDEDHKQPIVLNCSYPSILVKPNKAIAVGESCTFGSFPLSEVCDTTIAYINDKNINLIDYLTPDFSTGGELLYDKQTLKNIYKTGKGSIILRSKYRFDEQLNMIEIYEIPYSTTVNKIVDEVKDKMLSIKDIVDVRNETGFNKETKKEELKITIDVRKNTNITNLMHKLFLSTSLQSAFSFNMNCLVDFKPQVLGIKQILDEWLKFRILCVTKSLQYDINQKSDKLHLLKGLEKVLLDIDKAIEIIRYTKEENIILELISHFHIDNIQAEEVANMKLRYINRDYILNKVKDIKSLEDEILKLQNTLNNPNAIDKIIIKDLIRVRDTYGKERKTDIIYPHEIQEISADELIPNHSTTIVFTKEQYIKKTLRYADKDKQGVKEGDEVLSIIQTTNRAEVMLLSNQGNCYKLKVNDLQERQPSALGQYLPTLLNLDKDEKLIGMLATSDFKGYGVISFSNGKVVKIPLESYATKQNRSKLQNSLSLDSAVVSILQISEDTDIYLESSQNKALIINTSNINEKATRNSQGVQTMKSNKQGFEVVKAEIYNNQVDESYRVNSTSAGKSL